MRFLRQNTAVIVTVGPFYDKGDGVTIEGSLTITNERITLTADTDAGSAPTNILDNVTGATSGTANDLNYITGNDAGMMQLELAAADTNRVGRMFLSITDAANHVPVFHEFFVLPATIFDWLTGVTANLKVDVDTIKTNAVVNGGTITFPTTATLASTTNITAGTVTTATNVTTVNGLAANVITAASINADAITAAKIADGAIDAATFAAGAINAAAIATGAIDADAIADNAIDAGAIASDAITAAKIATGAITAAKFAAGAIDAAAIAAGAIDADALAADAVTEIHALASGTADSGTTTTMVDAARTEADTDYWKDLAIVFTSGTIAGQARLITAFTPGTDTITFSPATTQAVGTNTYEIRANVAAAGASAPTAAEVADAVWDEDATAHQTQGTFGQAIGDPAADTNTIFKAVVTDATGATVGVDVVAVKGDTAAILADTGTDGVVVNAASLAADATTEIANAVWDTDCTGRQTQGTFGQAIGDPAADTNTLYKAVVTDAAGATVGVDIVAVKAETAAILTDTAVIGATGEGLTSLATQASINTIDDFLDTEIAAILAAVDTEVAAIKAVTDLLPNAGALTNLDAAISTRATPAQVNTEVLDVLNVDTFAQPGQGTPAATNTIRAMLAYLYKAWRNRTTQTASAYALYNDDAATVDHKATFADDATTADRGEVTTGP